MDGRSIAENPPGSGTDEALILAVASSRDKAAFRVIFDRYAGRVKGFMIRSGAASEEADEAVQETMLSIWRKAAQFDPSKAPAAAWIFGIARNRRIDQVRKVRRAEPDPNDPLFQPDPEPPAEVDVIVAERDAALREAIGDLTEAQREAVRLAFFSDMSHPQIAEATGAPLGTVKSRLRLAVERLRATLGGSFGEEFLRD